MKEPTEQALRLRRAQRDDLPALVRLLADDPLGAHREVASDPLPQAYYQAFAAIDADPNNELIVASLGCAPVGMLQLTYIPYLTHQGSWRALIEGVRVDARHRSRGLGTQLFEWAIQRATERGCRLLQLTSDKQRPDAIRFYESLGFVPTHEGLKLALPRSSIASPMKPTRRLHP
jgi:GNAT superfamily N-acetyltransferase